MMRYKRKSIIIDHYQAIDYYSAKNLNVKYSIVLFYSFVMLRNTTQFTTPSYFSWLREGKMHLF